MNFVRAYNYIIAIVLIVIYLALPATSFASAILDAGLPSAQAAYSTAPTTAPCDNCPCSGGQDSDCCDTTFCDCSCHAPLGQGLKLTYAPVIVIQSFPEPSWSLPQSYRSIFVPPQNPA
jgi:hypothetical protein